MELGTCAEDYHDGGTGTCLPLGVCARGYHNGGDGTCVELGTCVDGFGTDGDGECLLKFVSIPSGGFTLTHDTGSHLSGQKVSFSAFQLGKTPVTVGQFQKCVAAQKCSESTVLQDGNTHNCRYRSTGNEDYPINCIKWKGAQQYCDWIGGRLPTEEEWEYASTHNGTTWQDVSYPWGTVNPVHCETASYYINMHRLPFCDKNTECPAAAGPAPVGTYSPKGDSPLGLTDMASNIQNWTASPWVSESTWYTTKGGAWDLSLESLPVSTRSYLPADRHSESVGFRCAKDK